MTKQTGLCSDFAAELERLGIRAKVEEEECGGLWLSFRTQKMCRQFEQVVCWSLNTDDLLEALRSLSPEHFKRRAGRPG
jgi:hypothetical protein